MTKAKRIWLALVFLLIFHSISFANYIDINRIVKIESNGNPLAYNKKDGDIGLCQITPICLKEWNNFHPKEQYTSNDLFNPVINLKIAEWYLEKRIPQMLKYYKCEVNTMNILICYNAGIKAVVKGYIPLITKRYLMKYGR